MFLFYSALPWTCVFTVPFDIEDGYRVNLPIWSAEEVYNGKIQLDADILNYNFAVKSFRKFEVIYRYSLSKVAVSDYYHGHIYLKKSGHDKWMYLCCDNAKLELLSGFCIAI